ncbi:hypothetical protein NMG60_11023757 [Bertholletia excelsa]
MLELNPNLSTCKNPSQALLALKPRQVLLAEQSTKKTMMKKSKNPALNSDQKALLLCSVLQYLESNGFSRSLKRLLSEAQIQDVDWKTCSLNLEDMYINYLETKSRNDSNFDSYKEQELLMNGSTKKKDGDNQSSALKQTMGKKKKKKGDENDGNEEKVQLGASDDLPKDKKKSKKVVDSLGQDENVNGPSLSKTTVMDESTKKEKESKKKKGKSTFESLDGNVGEMQLDSLQEVNVEPCEIVPEVEAKTKDKKKKKKKDDSVSEVSDPVAEMPEKEEPPKSKSKKEDIQNSEGAIDKEKKSSKKRKRLTSDENEGQPVDKLVNEELKRRKTGDLEEAKNSKQLTEMNAAAGDNKHDGKGENGSVSQNEFEKESVKQLKDYANGELEKNGEKSAAQKSGRKQQNGSAEPKTVNAFQRVKIDQLEFADVKLRDNSYWAKDGAESGYGAKAQEILGQVRGRGFRHEKTKKKRGSYRGGQIDLHSHSVKFNYSDDD